MQNNILGENKFYSYKVSIIVPCYNVLPWLNECLQSLVDQTLQDIEIICINDGSTDGTGVRLDEWQNKYSNKIKVIHQANGGLSNARNSGMKIAQGECIGFVDSDDFIDICMYVCMYVCMYEKLYTALNYNKADIAQCNFCYYNGKNNKIITSTNYHTVQNAKLNDINVETNISVWNRLFTKKFLTSNNLYFLDEILLFEDLPFSLELLFNQPKITILKDILYYYRIDRSNSLSCHAGNDIFGVFNIFKLLNKKNKHYIQQNFKILILKFKLSYYAESFMRIKNNLKITFIKKASQDVFINNKVNDIYKIVLTSNYRKFYRHILGLGFVMLLHIFYISHKIKSYKFIK